MSTKKKLLFVTILIAVLSCGKSCSSGRSLYNKGEFYKSTLKAIQRLQLNPTHKKAAEILKASYPLAIKYLESEIEIQVFKDSRYQYRKMVENFEKINTLYEKIKRSPGALTLIPNPSNKYKEIAEARENASDEVYQEGIQALLKNTREDAKKAYFLFKKAYEFHPQDKKSLEMLNQAKYNATLRVVVAPPTSQQPYISWNFESTIFGYQSNEFVKFYSFLQAQEEKIEPNQLLQLNINGISLRIPSITKNIEHFSDSVYTGEIEIKGVKTKQYKQVMAIVTRYSKSVSARGSISLTINDTQNKTRIYYKEIVGHKNRTETWGEYTGDSRALPESKKKLCAKKEPYMGDNVYFYDAIREMLDRKLRWELTNFYRNY